MTHEFINMVSAYGEARDVGLSCVLATVVALEGSSYRRPGVRMLIREDGKMTGAVSGGCVEKEIVFQAQSVFSSKIPKMMAYDGRFRLGCEGILYILVEPFAPDAPTLEHMQETFRNRVPFQLKSVYQKEYGELEGLGTSFVLNGKAHPLYPNLAQEENNLIFEQEMGPIMRLVIIGGEHDSVKLAGMAAAMGWEVNVSTVPQEEKTKDDFPGVHAFWSVAPEAFPAECIDSETAVVLMTHSYAKDLKYLLALKDCKPLYFGLLGPQRRREKLFNEFMERHPEVDLDFFDRIHGPAGLHLGAETPEEIALSILAELLSVMRKANGQPLRNKTAPIHD
jgi:xanthine dehydrogenase accessory factor